MMDVTQFDTLIQLLETLPLHALTEAQLDRLHAAADVCFCEVEEEWDKRETTSVVA
ncbi:hypothetical protein ACFQDN_24385 [Pseudomonas asuensis]|jgi:hypothetical protein|uniref:Uncharacterized protein n=2 Tax=Pseudomonas asuensis TaxID=1825787 RepID=A0ABQ2GZ33_9PSED|nr:hypothetical protein GCM10009425_32090 [Pseudomonas asuensis]